MARAEYHEKVATGGFTVAKLMHAVYTAVNNQVTALGSNKVLQFSSTNGVTALHNGSAFATPGADTFWANNSYMVIEPTANYPGGGKWQVMLKVDGSGNSQYILGPLGDWSNLTGAFASYDSGSIELFVSKTDVSHVWVSMANRDTYDSGSKYYSYLRVLTEPSGGAPLDSIYVGGYIPFQASVDTKPICALSGIPTYAEGNDKWVATSTSASNNRNRVPVQYDHAATMTGTGSFASLVTIDSMSDGFGDDRSGKLVATTPYLASLDGHSLGVFGAYTMKGFETQTAWTADSAAEYVTALGLLHRFKAGATVEP